jgi:hypothetical protein
MSVLIRRVVILYLRQLLCLQSLFIAWLGWAGFLGRGPDTIMLTFLIMALIATIFAAAGIVAALAMTQGRRWAAIVALVVAVLWAAVALLSATANSGSARVGQYYFGLAIFLTAIIGLLLKPVRSYCGLARRPY